MSLPEHPSLSALEDAPLEPRKIGGKAAALGTLLRRGVAMPVTWVLDTAPFRDVVETELPSEHEPRALLKLKKPHARLERAAQARQRLLEAPANEALEQALAALWRRLEPVAPWGLAVRASPSVDDDSEASMAGLTGAVLGVRGGPALAAAVRQLWALAFSPRALVYLAQRKVRDLAMAVVFQPVVIADVAGVLATRPPTGPLAPRERQGERLVNAWWGLSPWVEGGDAALDVVRLSSNGDVIEQRVADKPLRLLVSPEGTSWGEVAPEQRQRPCLDGTRRRSLAALAHRLDALDEGGDGYEAAFAFVGDRLLLLQAQRGRGVGFPEGGGEQTVWSRTTVTESLSGVVSPLTLSLSEPFVEESFRHTFERLGTSVPDDRLIASVHGRAYLNLSALLRMAVQLPGLDAHAVVQLAGVEATEALERQLHDVSRRGFYTRLPLTAARQVAEQGAIGTLVEQAEALAVDAERAVEEIDLVILPDDALVIRLRELRDLLGRATTVLATVTTAYVTSHLALSATIGRSAPAAADRLAAVISAGVIGLEATRPALALAQIAAIARDEPAAREALAASPPAPLPPGPTRSALARFVAEHGHLCRLASELMHPRWREDDAPLRAMLAALVAGGRSGEAATAAVRARADRERATFERSASLVDRLLLRGLVERSRRLTELRERARGRYLRALALWRKAAVEIDRRLRRVDPALAPDAVFFCSVDELLAALSTGRPRVAHLVQPRRAERERDLALADPPTTFIGAPPSFLLLPPGGAVLRGVAASGGVVTGRVRVIRDLTRDAASVQRGEILVVKSADLGLSPLFLVAGGVVSQQGGRLTQGAVVARELGLPAVASVSGATRILRTGDRVRLDGDEGTVELLDPPATGPTSGPVSGSSLQGAPPSGGPRSA